MSDTPYEYTDQDRLENPETYEYSTVYGASFLDAYVADRVQTLETIDAQLPDRAPTKAVEQWSGLLSALNWADTDKCPSVYPKLDDLVERDRDTEDGFENEFPALDAGDNVRTLQILASLLGYPDAKPPVGETPKAWLDRFTKRFEVQKRLYVSYGEDMRPKNGESAPLVAYPMLALAALVYYGRTDTLKYLNVALKLGDVLSSKCEEIRVPGTLVLTRLCIEEEKGCVRSVHETAQDHDPEI